MEFSSVFPILSPLLPLHLEFHAWGSEKDLCRRLQWVTEFVPFAVMWSWPGLCPAPSSLGLVLSSASTVKAYFALRFPILRFLHCSLSVFGNALLLVSELPTFYERLSLWAWFFIGWFNREKYASQLSGVVELCFLDSPSLLCFLFSLHQTYIFHKTDHTSGREVFCFLVRLPPDHVYPSSVLSFNKMNLPKPVHASDSSFSPSTFQ